jgi:hypothetical protein
MESEHRKSGKKQLALALAQGISAAQWARDNGVTKVTAYRWAKEPAVRKWVEGYRRRTIDQLVSRMTEKSNRAFDIVLRLAEEAESESVRLRSARSVFSDMIMVSKYSGLEARLFEVEEKLEPKKAGGAGTNPWGQAPANYGTNPPGVRPVSPGGAGAG